MKKSLIAFLFIVSICSCFDLDEDPKGLLNPELFFETPTNVEMAVLGAYGLIASENLYGRKLALSLLLRSDMCDIGDTRTTAGRKQVNSFNMDSKNNLASEIWIQSYKVIGAANTAIYGAELILVDPQKKDLYQEEIDPLKAEARFVRAFMYYHLVRLFGDIPYIDFYVNNPDEVKNMSQSTSQDVYDGIIADLEYAKANLPDKYPSNTRARATKGTAAAYLASVYLTLASESGDQSNFEKAYNEAKYVIDNASLFGYDQLEDFQDLFDATNSDGFKEHLLVFDFLAFQEGDEGQNRDLMAPTTGIRDSDNQGWSIGVPSLEVYNSWNGKDYRKQKSLDTFALVNGDSTYYSSFTIARPHIAKYSRYGSAESTGAISDNNYSAMRFAEVLLIAAEACNDWNDCMEDPSYYVNLVRERAQNGDPNGFPEAVTFTNQEEFRDIILEERRLELAFEFKRWYDIKRRNLGTAVFMDPLTSLEPHENFTDRDYLFPLPQDELDRSPNLIQNPGY